MNKTVYVNNAGALGRRLAHIHSQELTIDSYNYTEMDGRHLYLKGLSIGMPVHKEIEAAVMNMDAIIKEISSAVPHPSVMLWNKGKKALGGEPVNPYGNPAWDLGLVINTLQDEAASEDFLRQYLDSDGVAVTILELYVGVLYALLNDAVARRDKVIWQQLAKNECVDIVNNHKLQSKTVTPDMLARLGLPGLKRI